MSSPYARSRGGSGSPYARDRGPSGSSYSQPRGSSAPAKKSGGGFLHAIEHGAHVVGQKVGLAAHDVKAIPGGIVHMATTEAHAIKESVEHPWVTGKQKQALLDEYKHPLRAPSKDDPQGQALNLVRGQVIGAKESILHPGRDPFQTLLTVLPLAHGAGRVAAAARSGDVGALARPYQPPARTLRVGDSETPLVPSRNPVARAVQGGYDKALQQGLDRNPEGRVAAHAQKRVGGALREEARIQQKMRAVPAQLLDRSAAKLAKTPHVRREQQAALELASVQTMPKEAAAYHFEQAANGVNPQRNLAVGHLYNRVAERGYLVQDEAGRIVVNAERHPKLAAADQALAQVQGEGDTILAAKGIRSESALAERRNAPARIRAGATFEKPTPGKQGVSPALVKATAERDRIAALHERALGQEEKWHTATNGGAATKDLRSPMSDEQAVARLAVLDRQHAALVEKIVPEVSQYGGKLTRQEQLVRNFTAGKTGIKPTTVKQEEAQAADAKLREVIAANPDHPVARQAADLLSERDTLRAQLNARGEASLEGTAAKPLPRTGEQPSIPAASNPYRNRIVQLGTRLEAAQQRVDRLAETAAKRVKPTGIVGGEQARPGRGFVSARVSEKKLGKAEASASTGPVVGVARSPIDSKTFTGRSIEQGLVPKNVTASASRHFRQILRFVNTDAQRRRALETGSDVRRSNRDVLVRVPDETAAKLSDRIQQELGRSASNVDTPQELATQEGLHAAHQAFVEQMLPGLKERFAGERQTQVGVQAPDGYRWVDQGALGDLTAAPFGARGRIARSVDSVNSAVTALTVYFKVGHVGTRVFTNAATNIIQGSARPKEIGRSVELWKSLSDEQQARALSAAGQHGFSALPHEGTNLAARVATRGARWWAEHADAAFRFNSLAYELRHAGYGSRESFLAALDHLESGGQGLPAHEWSRLSAAARRADREAISYDRLNDFERRFITRGVWFYPWIKGSSIFTVRTAIEHPYKAGILGNAGAQGRERQQRTLGDVPSYEQGLFALTGGEHPLTTDFSTFSPFATGADVLEAPIHPGALAGFLNPVAGAAGQFVYGLNQYGAPSKQPYLDSLMALGSPTSEQQLAEAFAARGQDQSRRMFHKTPWSVLERAMLGPGTPRRVNKDALASAAARELSGRR